MRRIYMVTIIFSILIIFKATFISCSDESVAGQSTVEATKPLAFPGAEGFGKFTTGGRGGKVLIVDNLHDSGPGSLREALNQKFPRTIVFAVSGTIPLESELKIKYGDLTIAGQSAPGDGICLKNYPLIINASNVIIRYIRARMGDEKAQQNDCMSVIKQRDIIIDHCTFSWATDEVASCYDNENFTMQWCIISESLNNSVHQKGEHGYGGIWGGKGASFHHNLLAHHNSRMPRFCGSRYHKEPEREVVDYRNNVIYNWRSNNAYAGELGNHNMVNNYYKPGPATAKSKRDRILNPYSPYGKFYLSGNVLEGVDFITKDNWKGVVADHPDSAFSANPITVVSIPEQGAAAAFKEVLKSAGANHCRDAIDTRLIREVEKGTAQFGPDRDGIIDTQKDVGEWPELKTYGIKKDSDRDGMPDDWEKKNKLNPMDGSDHALNTLDKNYTNIEMYLNQIIDK
jgi:pectate lyase